MYIWPNYLFKTQYETAAPAFVTVVGQNIDFWQEKENPFYVKIFYLLSYNVYQIPKYLEILGNDADAIWAEILQDK